jgi:methylglyoxal synthase
MAVRSVGLVAHDHKKPTLLAWAETHKAALQKLRVCATGTTGGLLQQRLGLEVQSFLSGPLGGDLQIGTEIAEGRLDMLIFFWDPLSAQPHDPDVKALLRVAVLWDIPFACNETSATFLLTSRLMADFERKMPNLANYREERGHHGGF